MKSSSSQTGLEVQKSHRRKIFISCGLIAILSLTVVAITFAYISNERAFYFWDYSNYSNKTIRLAATFQKSPLQAIKAVRGSLAHHYSLLPCIPLIPFILIFGDSRIIYITSCALVYILPFSLIVGAIATRILLANNHTVFWSAAFLTLLIPPTWVSILKGYPDIGAAIIIGLAILVYLKDVKLQSWWQILLIGFLLSLAILFRRHFAYSSRAFLVAMFLQGFLVFLNEVRNEPSRALRNLFRYTLLIGLIGLSSLATQALLAPKFLYTVLTTDFRFLYASYERSFGENFQYYGQAYGWLIWLLTILGFSAGTLTRVLLPPKTSFILIFGSISLIQWGLFSRQISVHYTTHFTFFVALGLTVLLWTTWLILKEKARILMLVAVIN